MERKAVLGIMLTLLLISTLTLVSNIQPVKASGTIYIRSDGTIDPPTANIVSADDITYTFIDNIYDSIVVERSNIIIDGNGYILQGSMHSGTGIYLSGRSNVTIKNTQVTDFSLAIHVYYSSNLTLTGNNASDNWSGICCQNCSNVIVANNTASDNTYGIWLRWDSNNSTVVGNNASKNYYGISIETGSSDNICSGNNASINEYGIRFYMADNNIVYHNDFIDNTQQVYITSSSHDNVWDNGYPSGGNYWSDYTGVDEYSGPNQDQPGSDGIGDTQYTIDANNTDTYPLMGASHDIAVKNVVPSGTKVYEGEVVNINVTVKNEGTFSETFNVTTFYDSSVIQTQTDVALNPSIETTLTFSWNTSGAPGNHEISAEASIVSGETDTSDNIFVNGIVEVTTNIDLPIDGENATVEGNVTITKAKASKNTLRFDASGPSGSTGWINVTFPMVNTTDIKVFINNEKLTPPPFPIITTNGTHYFIYFEFPLSTHKITIQYAIGDIAITDVKPNKTVVGEGYPLNISITVQNLGDNEETFNVTAFRNETAIISPNGKNYTQITLSSGNSTTITITCNTTGFAFGNYTISAYVTPVPGETDTADNTYVDGWVIVTIAGDIDADWDVDFDDFILFAGPYGTELGEELYDATCDLDGDGYISFDDFIIFAAKYGKTI